LAAKVGRSLTRWLAQMEHEWQQLRHVPLDDRENDYIRKLYSSNSQEISYAITRLVRVDCRDVRGGEKRRHFRRDKAAPTEPPVLAAPSARTR
jgi:hypothetical protein